MPKVDRPIGDLIDAFYRNPADWDIGEFGRQLIVEWQRATGRKEKPVIGQDRFRAMEEALAENDPSVLRYAVWGISRSEWHAERGIDEFKVALLPRNIDHFAQLGAERLRSPGSRKPTDAQAAANHAEALEQGYVIRDGVYVLEQEDENDRQLRLAVFGQPDVQTTTFPINDPSHPVWDALEKLSEDD